MLKRLFQVPLSTTHLPPGSSASSHSPTNFPQPIKAADKQRLIKLSDPQDKVCVSDWSCSQHFTSSAHMASSETLQVEQLKQHIRQQQQLRQVECKLRQTLNFSTIAGTAVVETAGIFNAKQVTLVRYDRATQSCQQVVRYCQNQRLAWQPACNISETEFPALLHQLWQGKMLRILPGQLETSSSVLTANDAQTQATVDSDVDNVLESSASESSVSESGVPEHEIQQWLARWPGSWLLIPIKKSPSVQPTQSSLTEHHPIDDDRSTEAEAFDSWGFMALALPKRESWTDTAASVAHSITVTFTAAIQHAQQYHELTVANQELQKLALSDGLTCLANRRRFDEHLTDEWQRLAREKQPLSLILCDLDHFKRYNDTFGHPAGDRCLIRVARALLSGPQRPADLVARYGGEEFAIVLPNTDTHGAWRIAQKIHESIRALQIKHAPDNEESYVTVTMGVSTVIPGHDNTAQMLVQASDLALYHAKQQGRNRTYVNGHYNTVSEDQVMGKQTEGPNQLDVMPVEAGE